MALAHGDQRLTANGALDALDIRILDIVQRDVSMPVADMAAALESSKSVVWRRIQLMLDRGVIRSRVALVDPRKVGLDVLVFVRIRMAAQGKDLQRFMDVIRDCPEVVECHSVLGEVDFMLKVIVPTLDAYETFFERKLSRIEGVREVQSSVSVKEIVNTTELPLRLQR